MNKNQKNKVLKEIDREYNLTMSKLNKIEQDFFNFVKKRKDQEDQERIDKLRKKILNK